MSSWDSNWQPGRGDASPGHEDGHIVKNFTTTFAALASLGSALSLVAWAIDSGKQVPCLPPEATIFNLQTIVVWISEDPRTLCIPLPRRYRAGGPCLVELSPLPSSGCTSVLLALSG